MNTQSWKRWMTGLGLVALGCFAVGRARAANPAYLNIDVTINANLSVSVNGVASSTDTSATWNTATPNAKLVDLSSATVLNDSGGTAEKWALATNANSIDLGGGSPGSWALQTTTTTLPGSDQFALQAVFGSSNTAAGGCPIATSADWDQAFAPALTTSPVTYTSAVFADSSLNANGTQNPDNVGTSRMTAGSKRALCWRIITPNSTSTADTQNIQVIVSAQP